MGKIIFTPVVGNDNAGKAVAKANQVSAISNTGITYIENGVYVAMPQYAHSVNLTINGQARTTNRILVIEYVKNSEGTYEATGNITAINVNSLLGTNFGAVSEEPAPVIDAEQNPDGLWRAIRRSGIYKRTISGNPGLSIAEGDAIKIASPVAFQCMGNKQVYVAKINDLGDGRFDFEVIEDEDGNHFLDLNTQNATFWEAKNPQQLGISAPKLSVALPNDFPNKAALCID